MDQEKSSQQNAVQKPPTKGINRRTAVNLMAGTGIFGAHVGNSLRRFPDGNLDEAGRSGADPALPTESQKNLDDIGTGIVAATGPLTAVSIWADKAPGCDRRAAIKLAATGGAVWAGGELGYGTGVMEQRKWAQTHPPKPASPPTTQPDAEKTVTTRPNRDPDKDRAREGRER